MSTLRIGFIGLDSSHCIDYARLLHESGHADHVPGGRVVAAYAGGSPDWELSSSRVAGFTQRIADEFGIRVEKSIEDVVSKSDALMILSVDGRVHLDQFEAVAASGKPVYIDKPLAMTVAEAKRMRAIAEATGARLFSASVMRYAGGLETALSELGEPCRRISLRGPWPLHSGMHGWFFYGIHHVEMVYAAMGSGCQRVDCIRDGTKEVLTGYWADGRMADISTCHDEERSFAGCLLGLEREVLLTVSDGKYEIYSAFLRSALEFFKGGPVPVPIEETLETIAFMEAAAESARQNGAQVDLSVD